MTPFIAYLVNELGNHDTNCAYVQFKILKEIYEKDKNIAVFTEYLTDDAIRQMYENKYDDDTTWLPFLKPLCEFCKANNIPIFSLEPIKEWYHISGEFRSVQMFKRFLKEYREKFYGKEEKNLVLFMAKFHGDYFEELLNEMGYQVILYDITPADKDQINPDDYHGEGDKKFERFRY